MPSSLLIFGGTFDPPHRAHTELPPVVSKRLGCDRILYIPAAINPLKGSEPPTAADHRLAMLRLAVAPVPNAEISTVELERCGPSYTVETLEALRNQVGEEVVLRLLLGSDLVLEFLRWHEPQRILELATPVVLLRPPSDKATFRKRLLEVYSSQEAEQWLSWVIAVVPMDVTASEIRHRLRAGQNVDGLLEPAVIEYIREHGLYGIERQSDPGAPGTKRRREGTR